MQLWICDSRVRDRWEKWLQQRPVNWSAVPISDLTQVPADEVPSLLLIHSNDAWTKGIPRGHLSTPVVLYTDVEQDLGIQASTGYLFCSLDTLQERLLQILRTWHTATLNKDWLWDMLGGNIALEVSLELLHQLLPPSLNQTSPRGKHHEVWDTLTEYVYRLENEPNFRDIETAYKKSQSLYEMCVTVDEKYTENLRVLRDSLLGNNASTGLVGVIERARRGNGG